MADLILDSIIASISVVTYQSNLLFILLNIISTIMQICLLHILLFIFISSLLYIIDFIYANRLYIRLTIILD